MKRALYSISALIAMTVSLSLAGAAYGTIDDNEIKFTGVIESLPSTGGFIGDWRVSGRTVHVTPSTQIEQEHGRVQVGATVKVEGNIRLDNSVDAEEIEVKDRDDDDDDDDEVKFKGTIETLPATPGFIGDWRVGGRTIHVTSSTRIKTEDGPVAVGAFVEIEGRQRADGSMDAVKIEVESNVGGGDGRDELKGRIESLPGTPGFVGDWRVGGRTVRVIPATVIDREHGPVAVGAQVEVKGTMRADGSIDAARIEVKSASSGPGGEDEKANLKGIVQSLPGSSSLIGDWIINNRVVHVTSSTRLKAEHGAFAVGVRVKVKGIQLADGSILASRIQVRD